MFKTILSAIALLALIKSDLIESSRLECSDNSADWCKNINEAQACNVVYHCWKYVWSKPRVNEPVDDAPLVNFTLYYETLCPDCRNFMTTQLWSAFQSISSIMNLTVVPYGNARETWRNETKLWQFTCQHGVDECWANLLHTCVIYFYPNPQDHLTFIHCMEGDNKDDVYTAADRCGQQFKDGMKNVYQCMNSRTGNNLEHQMALKTEALNPPHKYVPWVTLNGVHTEEIENRAETDLIGLICDTYKGKTKPAACTGQLSKRKCMRTF